MSKERFELAKKADARNERAKSKPLKCKLSEPPKKLDQLELNVNLAKSITKIENSAPLGLPRIMTEVQGTEKSKEEK